MKAALRRVKSLVDICRLHLANESLQALQPLLRISKLIELDAKPVHQR